MLQRLLPEDIHFSIQFDEKLGLVKADPGQIEQVIMNLAVNARDAMPKGGRITIETENEYLDEYYAQQHLDVSEGHYVRFSISDTGEGMDEKTITRIFEPFFTTKEIGKGTGLGLATVHGIVKQLGGDVWVYSEPGRGTIFKVYLPRVDPLKESEISSPSVDVSIVGVPSATETILLVDDNEALRSAVSSVLQLKGYTVILASNGKEAIEKASQYVPPIHLLVTDMVMPQMGGRELAIALRDLRPEMKVLYMSGYAEAIRLKESPVDSSFLSKPASMVSLLAKVRELLSNAL